ncbi:MAG: hypothetical protein RSB29_00025 [Alistipes sp.]
MKKSGIIWFVAACMLLVGCFKTISYQTTYVLRPLVQIDDKDGYISLEGAKAYAFAVDTTTWTVASYDDALAGVLTEKNRPAEKFSTPTAHSEPFPPSDTIPASVNWIQMSLEAPSMMIVVVDPTHKLYAYRQQDFTENLSPYYISVVFRAWQQSHTEGPWHVVNEFYIAPQPPLIPDPIAPTPDPVTPPTE